MALTKVPPEMIDTSADYAHFQDQKANGTDGGGATGGATVARVLNATVTNTITGCSLGSNQITLPAGTYEIEASTPALAVDRHRAKLYNVTDATNSLLGTCEYSINATSSATIRSFVRGRITIAAQKVFELRHYTQTTKATTAFGAAVSSGDTEVYSEIRIWKLA